MADESVLRDLFDQWERVWHEGKYDLVPECVGSDYIRHDEAGDRTVTREAYARESPRFERSGPIYVSLSMTTRSKTTARGFALPSNGLIPRPASRAVGQACSPTG